MKDQFATYPVSKMLKELGFNEPCFGLYGLNGEFKYSHEAVQLYRPKNSELTICTTAPLWQQVKQWLFEKHTIYFNLAESIGKYHVSAWNYKKNDKICGIILDSPITAEIEGIISAVEYLNDQLTIEP